MWNIRVKVVIVILISAGFAPTCSGRAATETANEKRPSVWESIRKYYEQQTKTVKPQNNERIVHFPSDRSLGMLKIQDAGIVRQIKDFNYWVVKSDWWNPDWEYLCEATGDVTVPAGKRLALFVNKVAWRDLSPLSELRPNDLYMLSLAGSISVKPDDRCMQHIAGLTGLKVLSLLGTNISSKGLRYIKDFKKLERLYLPDRITNAGMADVAELHSLKGLYFKINRVTNAGLRHLSKLTSLEELELGGGQIDDAGLVHLAKLKSLNYLLLFGYFSDAGMAHLKDIPNLRILNIGFLGQITDEGLANLAGCTQLERISLGWNENITDKGASYLATIPSLKMIDLSHAHITDAGLAHLAKIKSLEYLELPRERVTNKGLGYLWQLTNLKHLKIPRTSHRVPYADKGLEELSKLQALEELFIADLGVTDAEMSHVAKLTNLKRLTLFGCPITNKGLAKLKALKSLEYLWLYEPQNITISDLKDLNALPNLVELNVQEIIQDNSGLDISGLTRLEKLMIGTHHKGDGIRDEDLACLANLKNLRWFQVSQAITKPLSLTDAGVAHLAGLTNMDRLTIGGPELTDKALGYLKDMKKLDMLNIYGGNFTDEGLANLEGLKALQFVRLAGTHQFSPRATNRLKKELPNLYSFKIDLRDLGFEGAEAKLSKRSK